MPDQKRVNGNGVSWGSIKLRIGGDPYFGFTGITFGHKLERILGYGLGAHHGPRVRSKGKYTPEVSKLTGWAESVEAAREALAAQSASGTSYGSVEFDVILQAVEAGKPPITVELLRCTWVEESAAWEENPDPLKEDFGIQPMRIVINGRTLYDPEDGDPN